MAGSVTTTRGSKTTPRRPQARLASFPEALGLETRTGSPAPKKRAARKPATDLITLRQRVSEATDVQRHRWIHDGVPTQYLRLALDWFTATPERSLLDAIGISYKTVERKEDATLNPQHSDAALALIEVTSMAEHALGSKEQAEVWLSKPALALEGERPIDLLTSAPGIEAVKDLLTRIEYGVYA